jgi:hypothetical protein
MKATGRDSTRPLVHTPLPISFLLQQGRLTHTSQPAEQTLLKHTSVREGRRAHAHIYDKCTPLYVMLPEGRGEEDYDSYQKTALLLPAAFAFPTITLFPLPTIPFAFDKRATMHCTLQKSSNIQIDTYT